VATTQSVVWGIVCVVGAFAVAAGLLYHGRSFARAARRVTAPLRLVHSGDVGDYVAWLTFGTALVGGVFALTLR